MHELPTIDPAPEDERELAFACHVLRDGEDAVVVTDAAGRTTWVNAAFRRLCGYGDDALRGRRPGTLLQGRDTDPAAVARIACALRRGEVITEELLNYHADGHAYWVSLRITPVRDREDRVVRFVAVEREITAAKAVERALRASEERFRALSEASPLGVFLADAEGQIVYANRHVERFWQLPADELRGAGWLSRIDPAERAAVAAAWEETLAGRGEMEHEYALRLPDGTSRLVRCRATAWGDGGVVRGVIGTVEDVTERRALERQLRQAQKMEAVGQLAGGVAHDFNNMLQVILANARLAREALPSRAVALDDLRAVEEAAERAAQLTRQLLAFSRKQVMQPRVIDVNAVVRAVESMITRLIGATVAVETRLDPTIGHVLADPAQLEQALLNLAINARDAMPGGGRLLIESAEVDLDGAEPAAAGADEEAEPLAPGRYVRLAVRDTGAGMDATTRARAFEPFFTTKPVGKGTGLGLSTVYGIVRQSGGRVRLASAPGEGTTVVIDLPRADASPAADAPTQAAARAAGTGTVLLVEDDPLVRDTVRRLLARNGYAVLEAADGDAGLAAAAAHAGPIHLVLADVVLPGVGGHELVERLAVERPAIRSVLMSGYAPDAMRRHALGAATVLLEKPFSTEALLDAVRTALEGSTGHA